MNIYTNSAERTVYLDVPVVPLAGTLDVEILKDDEVVHTVNTVVIDSEDRLTFTLPFSLVRTDADYEVHWRFEYLEDSQPYEYNEFVPLSVVTPILPFSEIKQILGDEFDDDEAARVEQAVRYVIQAHTGQFFGKYVGKISVTGSGEPYLRLPRKLISFSTLNGNAYYSNALALRGSGWYLKSKTLAGPPPIRADWDGWNEATAYSGYTPIIAPYSRATVAFQQDVEYVIDGVWGWNSVPHAVQEAAKLLINDYACSDAQYRDRFLSSITAADWRLQFHDGAFSNTGNARANQLLAEYILQRGWTVV
jgi:hypothetical protein